MKNKEIKPFHFLFTDTRLAWLWLIIRLYLGYEWVKEALLKLRTGWIGKNAGTTIKRFLNNTLRKASGNNPSVFKWYAYFIQHVVFVHPIFFSYLITFGELAVGTAIILGLFTGIAAFFGAFMNLNYFLAGFISVNPLMILLQILLILAWKTAGWFGLDRCVIYLLNNVHKQGIEPNKKEV